jgi:hypothetical protein
MTTVAGSTVVLGGISMTPAPTRLTTRDELVERLARVRRDTSTRAERAERAEGFDGSGAGRLVAPALGPALVLAAAATLAGAIPQVSQ